MPGAEHPHAGQQPVELDIAAHEPQEQGGLSMHAEQITGTLADLKTLVQGTPAAGDAPAATAALRSATSSVAPMPPAAARTPWRASG